MHRSDLTTEIRHTALKLGFACCGFARCEPLEEWRPFYTDFILQGKQAGFGYLERYLEKRLNPLHLLPSAKSVIALLMNYFPENVVSADDNFVISKYAYGKQYPPILQAKMEQLTDFMKSLTAGTETKIFADSGPVLEKVWAQRCGAGWQGKNSLIINRISGSFSFIGIIFTNIELTPDSPETNHCGDCRKCIDACPTGAIATPYQLEIRKCLSYYNIENKEECPEAVKDKFNDRIFGCDICQDVCPYNRFAKPTSEPLFRPHPELFDMKKKDWLALTPEKFDRLFAGTPVKRTGYSHFMKSIRSQEAGGIKTI